MQNASDKLADLMTIRQLIMQRLIAGENIKLNRELDAIAKEIEKKIVKGNLSNLQGKRLDKAIEQLLQYVSLSAPDLGDLAEVEARFAVASLGQVGFDATLPALSTIRSISEASLVQGATIGEWFGNLQEQTRFNLTREIKAGINLGETNSQILKRIMSTSDKGPEVFAKTRRDGMAIVRTSVQTIANEARLKTYEENEDILSGIQWVSTLDSRTSDICIARSGLVWTLPDYKPKGHKIAWNGGPPAHWACRSTTIPVTKSFKELGIDAEEIPAGTRSSMDGEVAQDLSFGDWLKGKPTSFADEMLGKGRAQLWRDGKITLTELLDQRGNPLTLAQLKAKYGTD